MKLLPISIALLLGATAVAFADSAKHDYDSSVDFGSYKTFQWTEGSQADDGSTTNYADSPMVRKRIQSALERELMADGLTAADGATPDIYVAYHATIKDKVQLDTTYQGSPGFRPSRRYPNSYGSVTVRTYEEGTLIVDVIDAAKNELVWRGWVSGAVGDPEKMEKRINKAVKKLFKRFPPSAK